MLRSTTSPRPDWQRQVEELGLIWHTVGDRPYWDESVFYSFKTAEIETIENATTALYELFLKAGQHVIDKNLLGSFGIPAWCHQAIRDAWDNEPAALNYGRFDLGYDGVNPPKLFEFNCDTPTSLLEAAVVQWDWKEKKFPNLDQYTSLHDKLIAKWRNIKPFVGMVHFAHIADDAGEDSVTTTYMRDLAEQSGVKTSAILMEDIGWDGNVFLDCDERPMENIYHLYPWEWLVNEEFGQHVISSIDRTLWIEPIWKMMWSNKAILPILWELNPNHPNLLESSRAPLTGDYVTKPLLAREGANVEIVINGEKVAVTDGDYGEEGMIYQRLYNLPGDGDHRPVIGAWIVDGEPAGMGIREDGLITSNTARFVPHVID